MNFIVPVTQIVMLLSGWYSVPAKKRLSISDIKSWACSTQSHGDGVIRTHCTNSEERRRNA